jgi:nitronate monooxygenase
MSTLSTAFTRVFGCRIPIMGAPMAGVSGGGLAAATCRAGGLGFVAAGHLAEPEQLRQQVARFRELAPKDAPLGLGFITYSSCSDGFTKLQAALDEHKPAWVQYFAPALMGDAARNVELARGAGAKVLMQVGCVRDAKSALEAGVDCIIAQGREAGGHGLRSELGSGTLPLAARVVSLAARYARPGESRTLVLAAGGVTCGRGLAAALALGCDGAVLGTRLWASAESIGKPELQRALLGAEADDVLRTRVFDAINNVGSAHPWPEPYDSVGALRNQTTATWEGRVPELQEALGSGGGEVASGPLFYPADPERAAVLAGEGVGAIHAIEPAALILARVEAEAVEAIRALQQVLVVS